MARKPPPRSFALYFPPVTHCGRSLSSTKFPTVTQFLSRSSDMLKRIAKWIDPLANPTTTSGLDEVVGTFSLHHAQLYVGTVRTDDGLPHKAIRLADASYGSDGETIGGLYLFDDDDATRLVAFLEAVLDHSLPASFQFPRSSTRFSSDDGRYRWTISSFKKKWHHGGGYKGKIGQMGGYIITKQSAERLQTCIRELFG